MVAFSRSSASARFQQILRTTAKHFSIDVPNPSFVWIAGSSSIRGRFAGPMRRDRSRIPEVS